LNLCNGNGIFSTQRFGIPVVHINRRKFNFLKTRYTYRPHDAASTFFLSLEIVCIHIPDVYHILKASRDFKPNNYKMLILSLGETREILFYKIIYKQKLKKSCSFSLIINPWLFLKTKQQNIKQTNTGLKVDYRSLFKLACLIWYTRPVMMRRGLSMLQFLSHPQD